MHAEQSGTRGCLRLDALRKNRDRADARSLRYAIGLLHVWLPRWRIALHLLRKGTRDADERTGRC